MTVNSIRPIWKRLLSASLLAAASCAAPTSEKATTPKSEAVFTKVWKISGDDVLAAVIDEAVTGDQLKLLSKKECGSREFCKILVWEKEEDASRGFPMTDQEVSKQVFAYSVNRATGFEQSLWNCAKFQRNEKDECLSVSD